MLFIILIKTSSIIAAPIESTLRDELINITKRQKPSVAALTDMDLAPLPSLDVLDKKMLFSDHLSQDVTLPKQIVTIHTKAFNLHYANAKQLAAMLKQGDLALLSAAGKTSVDDKSNTLWVRDNDRSLINISKIVALYDRPIQQVYIKAKVINIDNEYTRSLGVAFHSDTGSSGAPGGINDITIPIAKLGNNTLLEATLDALEKSGHAKLMSNPQLITLNRKPATIEAGEEVPYQQSTYGGGTSVAFKKAVLKLQVTPEIMPGQRILLHLTINQDQVASLTVNGVPAINTQQLMTQVYVKNKSTIVLGGISEQTQSQQQDAIPGISRVPLLGRLLAHHHRVNNRKQLLIFVTPVIVSSGQ